MRSLVKKLNRHTLTFCFGARYLWLNLFLNVIAIIFILNTISRVASNETQPAGLIIVSVIVLACVVINVVYFITKLAKHEQSAE